MKNFTHYVATGALLLLAVLFSNNVQAQNTPDSKWGFSIGAEGGLPTYKLRQFSKVEAGGTLQLQYNIKPQFAITVTSGYYNLFPANKDAATTTFGNLTYANPHSQGIIPVKLGVKDYVGKCFYIAMESGVGFETKYENNRKFILAPGFGFAGKRLDVGFRYEYFQNSNDDYGFAGVRLAVNF
jgi:hypothetical protein